MLQSFNQEIGPAGTVDTCEASITMILLRLQHAAEPTHFLSEYQPSLSQKLEQNKSLRETFYFK